ncbi:UNKNOWN [Stylonychia lemnae]|uniref:Uncharacterized protein n=1 Tax=Stylonychia lemnae TaxID=5949 RepID=A0A078AZ23_STYLE|nr:UNKNOWN [Stylonychia lemnae]|eukprot:CDW86452.1 UNKNOWN [Stylonychia lemnae]
MKKVITIAGAILLGTVVATSNTDELRIIRKLNRELATAERDIATIKDFLEGMQQRKRARSADPRVEKSSIWSKIHHGTGILNDLTQTGIAIYGATRQPHVENYNGPYYMDYMPHEEDDIEVQGLGGLSGLAWLQNRGTGFDEKTCSFYGDGWDMAADRMMQQEEACRMRNQQKHPKVQGLFSSLGRIGKMFKPISSMTKSFSNIAKPASNFGKILEGAKTGTDIISGLAGAGTGMYSDIMQGQASQAEQQYYQQQMQQQQQQQQQDQQQQQQQDQQQQYQPDPSQMEGDDQQLNDDGFDPYGPYVQQFIALNPSVYYGPSVVPFYPYD